MDINGYVARRMLWDICDIEVPLNSLYEPVYEALFTWMEDYSREFDAAILFRLPRCKTTQEELMSDMVEIYTGILSVVRDINDMRTLNCLFTVSFYMAVKYKDNPAMCRKISYYFELISYSLRSWDILMNRYENEI